MDFYTYANGGWTARNPVPPERPASALLLEIIDRNAAILRRIVENAAASDRAGSPSGITRKVGDYYSTASDDRALTSLGATPLREDLATIDAIDSPEELRSVVTAFHAEGFQFLFDARVEPDFQDPDSMLLYVLQGGLGLPGREYYIGEDDSGLRDAYGKHIAAMMAFLGLDSEAALQTARTVVELETELAEASLGAVELRLFDSFYRPVSLALADQETPPFPMSEVVSGLGIETERISFPHTQFFAAVNRMLGETSLDEWKAYLRWHLLHAMAPHLSPDIEEADFEFFGRALNGTQEMPSRPRRALDRTEEALGEALGQLYVREAFPPEAEARVEHMIDDLRAALRRRIENLDWMGDETRERALDKLDAFTSKVGHPDVWMDYSGLDVVVGDAYGNARRARAFHARRNLEKLGRPRDRTEWQMLPQSYSGFYDPFTNSIGFPAGSLQPPLFDVDIDDAVNYGATGDNIGHEMVHAFDDQGSRFDGQGRLADWWTEEDRAEFMLRARQVVDQYAGYEALPGLFVNGELTLGENIADLGGLMVAYDAFEAALQRNPAGEIDGFTPRQRFFLSYAQSLRRNLRDEYLRNVVTTDPHAPAPFRANGVVSNMPEFAAAFGCRPGDPMVKPDSSRVRIW